MRLILPLLVPALAVAAEGHVLINIDFADGKLAPGVADNTFKGEKPTLSVVDAADAKRGKELSVQVAQGGFAQLFLGKVAQEAGATYKGTVTLSASAEAKVQFYLRMAGAPYTRYTGTEAKVGATAAQVSFEGVAKEACADARLMIYTDAPVTLRIDDIRLEQAAPKAP